MAIASLPALARRLAALLAGACLLNSAAAAPDEDRLGKAAGYPVGTVASWFFDESVRVGSFTAQGEIPGLLNGKANVLVPAAVPMPLPKAETEPAYRWSVGGENGLGVDDYLARQRVMGLVIVKDGVIQLERYQYQRHAGHRFVSQSIAKSILSLAVGLALDEGHIRSLDDRASRYAPRLDGSLLGATPVRDLLRMASGLRCVENYDGKDDAAAFGRAMARHGIEAAAAVLDQRETAAGTRFSYCSANSHVLAAVLRGATRQTLAEYLTPRLWQAIGAETSALWRADRTGLEAAGGNFNATLRDYARLAIVLANDGVRPDDPGQRQIVPREYLLDATDWRRAERAFRPGQATPYYGYGHQFWTFPGARRRFALLGVYGQFIFVDPELRLVMVQTSANATAKAGQTSLAREADAFWRGVVAAHGRW